MRASRHVRVMIGLLVAILAAGPAFSESAQDKYAALKLFGEVFERIRLSYVDKVDDWKLSGAAISGLLAASGSPSDVDARSYCSRVPFKTVRTKDPVPLGLICFGASFETIDKTTNGKVSGQALIRAAIDAMCASLDPLTVYEPSVARSPGREVISGPEANTGNDSATAAAFQPVRGKAVDDIGYIQITSFSKNTTQALEKALGELKMQIPNRRITGYIVDLRNNSGGLIDQAISVAGTFLDRGEIASTQGREPDQVKHFTAHARDLTEGKPIIVLINGATGGASEIVAGALQDNGRATVVGTDSAGPGTIQTIIPLGVQGADGVLRLTTARYFTPSGRTPAFIRILPDVEAVQEEPVQDDRNPKLRPDLRSYIPADPRDDKAMSAAVDLLRGIRKDPAFPPHTKSSFSR
jgi:carboxyl-terminal processing protease